MPIPITHDLLARLAGEAAFHRGLDVYRNGQVAHWKIKGDSITAVVEGTYPYDVHLTWNDRVLDGYCSCPASENIDFCKHCVAVALALSENVQDRGADALASKSDAIQRYLVSLPKDEVVAELLKLIEQDSSLHEEWALKAELASGGLSAKEIRKRITKMLPYRELWEYRAVHAYFAHAETQLDLLLDPIGRLPAEERIKLAQYGLDRLNRALEKMDDSHGMRFGVEERLYDLLLQSFAAVDWPDEKRIAFLLEQLETERDVYPAIPGDFLQEDPSWFAGFIAACELRWRELIQADREEASTRWPGGRYTHILLEDARSRSDAGKVIDILRKVARSDRDYLHLFELYLQQEEYESAVYWLDKLGKSASRGYRSSWLEACVRLDKARGDVESALEKQWRLFSEYPGKENFEELLSLHEKIGLPKASCYERAERHLLEFAKRPAGFGTLPNSGLIDFYLYAGFAGKAIAYANEHPVDIARLLRLGDVALPDDPATAIAFYERSVSATAGHANNAAYREAVDLLKRLREQLASLGDSRWLAAFDDLVDRLRATDQLRRKRNFMALLDTLGD